jgi:hypothetical protein
MQTEVQDGIVNYNTFCYPTHPSSNLMCVMAVLVKRIDGYRVYAAIVPSGPDMKIHSDWIAGWGTKLRYSEAVQHFPSLKKEEYVR